MAKQEVLNYGDTKVPIRRESCAEMYIALQPPAAAPYMVVPRNAEVDDIVKFFSQRVERVEDLRAKMQKRFAKSKSMRCTYRTGDIAYVMGRPFMLHVVPLNTSGGLSKSARGRATIKYGVDTDVSLITLYVVQLKNYDQARMAFDSYANAVIMRNAPMMAEGCRRRVMPDAPEVPVKLRQMRNRFAKFDGKVLWLSTDIVPYPVDCLVYAIWRELMPSATVSGEEAQEALASVLPGWERAAKILAERAEPYSLQ